MLCTIISRSFTLTFSFQDKISSVFWAPPLAGFWGQKKSVLSELSVLWRPRDATARWVGPGALMAAGAIHRPCLCEGDLQGHLQPLLVCLRTKGTITSYSHMTPPHTPAVEPGAVSLHRTQHRCSLRLVSCGFSMLTLCFGGSLANVARLVGSVVMFLSLAHKTNWPVCDFWFSLLGNEDLFCNYKPFSSNPSCTSDSGQAFVRGCNENRAGHVDWGTAWAEGWFWFSHLEYFHFVVLWMGSTDNIKMLGY